MSATPSSSSPISLKPVKPYLPLPFPDPRRFCIRLADLRDETTRERLRHGDTASKSNQQSLAALDTRLGTTRAELADTSAIGTSQQGGGTMSYDT